MKPASSYPISSCGKYYQLVAQYSSNNTFNSANTGQQSNLPHAINQTESFNSSSNSMALNMSSSNKTFSNQQSPSTPFKRLNLAMEMNNAPESAISSNQTHRSSSSDEYSGEKRKYKNIHSSTETRNENVFSVNPSSSHFINSINSQITPITESISSSNTSGSTYSLSPLSAGEITPLSFSYPSDSSSTLGSEKLISGLTNPSYDYYQQADFYEQQKLSLNCKFEEGEKYMYKFSEEDIALATQPGSDFYFDPSACYFSDEELRPQPMLRKSRKQAVPECQKDDKYWARRAKNNMAAKKSREQRRLKENQVLLRALFLEKQNQALRVELQLLQTENSKIFHYLPQ